MALAGAAAVAAVGFLIFTRAGPAGEDGATLASFRPGDMHSLAVAPTDPRTLLFGSHQGMLLSRDAGAAWRRVASGDAMGIALAPNGAATYAAGHDVLLQSDDGGTTWRSVRTSLPGTDLHGFAAGVAPRNVYAFVAGRGLFKSVDGGSTWTIASSGAPASTMSLAVGRAGGSEVLLASAMDGAQRSRDGGRTWERIAEIGPAMMSAAGDTIYAAAGNFVFTSADGGTTWSRRTFTGGSAALVGAAPSEPGTVYVVTDRFEIYRSTDGGIRWERAG